MGTGRREEAPWNEGRRFGARVGRVEEGSASVSERPPTPAAVASLVARPQTQSGSFSSLRDLDCYVGTSATATITLSAELQMAMSELGLALELDVFVTP
jgi:hypothetical protein